MKKILLFILSLWCVSAISQTTGYFRYDTVTFQKIGGTTEFNLRNATRGVTGGVLTNMGNGRTAFVTPTGSANTSIGSVGFKVGVDETNIMKRINPFNGLTGDSATTGQVGVKLGGSMTENTTLSFHNTRTFTLDSVNIFTASRNGATRISFNSGNTSILNAQGYGLVLTNGSSLLTASGGIDLNSPLTDVRGGIASIGLRDSIYIKPGAGHHVRIYPVYHNYSPALTLATYDTTNGILYHTPFSAITGTQGLQDVITVNPNYSTSNTIAAGNNQQFLTFSGLSTNGYSITSSTTASGAGTKLLYAGRSGTHATSGRQSTTGYFINTHIGTGSENIALEATATLGDVNYAAKFLRGKVSFGTTSSESGVVEFLGSTSGVVTIQPAAAAGTYTLTLPTTDGGANEFLQTDGSGVLSWAAGGGSQTPWTSNIDGGGFNLSNAAKIGIGGAFTPLVGIENRDGNMWMWSPSVDAQILFGEGISGGQYATMDWNRATNEFRISNTNISLRIDNAGLASFGNVTPNSILHTTSFATAYAAKTSTYPITSTDHTIEATSGTFTTTLPTAVGITGRQYVITNSGSGVLTLATTSSQTFVNVTATPTTLTLNQFNTVIVVSNGANWLRISSL